MVRHLLRMPFAPSSVSIVRAPCTAHDAGSEYAFANHCIGLTVGQCVLLDCVVRCVQKIYVQANICK